MKTYKQFIKETAIKDTRPKLVLIRGMPGSGKSTIAKSMPGFDHYEADQYFYDKDGNYNFDANKLGHAHDWCQNSTNDSLARGRNVVVSNTFTTKKEMKPYFDMAKNHGIVPSVITAKGDYGSIHNVPVHALNRMKDRFEHDISDMYE